MVNPGERKTTKYYILQGVDRFHLRIDIANYYYPRSQVQALVAELVEWLAETVPKEAS